ncbi:MAG: homocysteine S-methyltransferase family protein [Clostridia bacterium]|nr:homocysteine S-methyltransferase family protein [Clostridia bacterium]
MDLNTRLQSRRLMFDGGTGSSLVEKGLKPGEMPETWNLLHPDIIEGLHCAYITAGADIIKTNTFGAYSFKLRERQEETVKAALAIAKRAVAACGKDTLIALDVGPLGKILEPFGDTSFDEAVGYFKELITLGKENADLILVETMSDLYEIKAAIVAAKECCDLPIAVTVALDERGRLLTGADVETVVAFLEGMGVFALGVNCGFGPKAVKPYVEAMIRCASVPVIANPNAGLPELKEGRAIYSLTPERYREEATELLALGVSILGGCCGTTPSHIAAVSSDVLASGAVLPKDKAQARVTSYRKTLSLTVGDVAIGTHLDPRLSAEIAEYLADGDMDSLVDECFSEVGDVDIITVSAQTLAEDEGKILCQEIRTLQESLDCPMLIRANSPAALRDACRYYNGKPLLALDSAENGGIDEVFSIVKTYGALFAVKLCGKNEACLAFVNGVYDKAKAYGLLARDILFDLAADTDAETLSLLASQNIPLIATDIPTETQRDSLAKLGLSLPTAVAFV